MAEAQINGIRISYDAAGDGPAVLLTHGYSATGRMWAHQIEALRDRYRIIAWDMRGHGETESPDDPAQYSEALTLADMVGLLEFLGEDRAVVGGLSLGGFMSLAFHLEHPEMVRALVLCDTGPGYRSPEARAGWNRAAEKRALDLEARGMDALGMGARLGIHRFSVDRARLCAGSRQSARGISAAAGRLRRFACDRFDRRADSHHVYAPERKE